MEALSHISATFQLTTLPKTKIICYNLSKFHEYPEKPLPRNALEDSKRGRKIKQFGNQVDYASVIQSFSQKELPHIARDIVFAMKAEGFVPDNHTLSSLMLCYANNGFLSEAQVIWNEILNSSFVPNLKVVSELVDAYGRMCHFDVVLSILRQICTRLPELSPKVYSICISCFGKNGELGLMEDTLREMVIKGFSIDSATHNAVIVYYSKFGCITTMENAYIRLKRSRTLIEAEGIKAISAAYIKEKKFYKLGEFLRDVGLGRRNSGNLLWNLLLLSYAANFKMKSLQREFVQMVEAGFVPDLTTFNIRALAFSRMSLFWDLHLSLDHMKYHAITPDLVTYGCVVDAYLDKRLGRNLDFALNKMNVKDFAQVSTDPIVFEVLGKGDFHSSSEALLEFKKQNKTYEELIAFYMRKKYRSNQVFWNY